MGIIQLLLICALIGLIAWALVTYVPMTPGIKKLIQVVAVVILVIIIISVVFPGIHDMKVPSVR